MSRLSLLVPLALLSGCIIYDTRDGKCPGCDKDAWWEDTGDDTAVDADGDGIPDDEDTDAGDTDEAPDSAFKLTPNVAEIGSTFIASLTTDVGFDFGTVQGVELYGEVDVLATESRPDELLLTLSVPTSALPGTADMLLLLPDDRVEFIGDALTLVVAGTGDGTDPDGSGDGTDPDGSGDGTDPDGSGDGTGGSGSCP